MPVTREELGPNCLVDAYLIAGISPTFVAKEMMKCVRDKRTRLQALALIVKSAGWHAAEKHEVNMSPHEDALRELE